MNVLDMALKGNLSNTAQPVQVKPAAVDKKKVRNASIVGSAIGIAGAVAGVYALAKKGNPSLTLKNLTYGEKDILMVGAGSVIGGLAGGMIADKDKNNRVPKLREATQQFFGSLMMPVGILAVAEKLLDKSGFKFPQIKSASKYAKFANNAISALPKILVTIGSLVAGMEIGNKIMNKVNNKIFKQEEKHDVHASDYLVHTDDLCIAANLLFKDAKSISAVTSKFLPVSFILAGTKVGTQSKD